MSGRDPSLMSQRIARFEHVEERLVLSASPWASLVHHAELDLPTVEETSPAVDVGGDFLLGDVTHHGELTTHLNGAHTATGVADVHADYGFYGSGQTVVVIDSGIAYDHYALGGGFGAGNRVVGGWDFAENDANPYDDAPAGFHGTHVAGIIGSDDATYMGVAPEVDLVALRVFDDAGNGNFGWVEDALDWVIANQDTFANPITTVNLSLGVPEANYGDVPSWAAVANGLESKFQSLNEAGIFVAVSAGNDFQMFNAKGLSYPAVSDWVVPVASANDAGTVMSNFSQRDDHVLVAPGESIASTVPDELFSFDGVPNDWASASGTSMASPYVAGASVLLREAFAFMGQSSVDQDAIYDALFDTASIINDPITGGAYHFINVEAALGSIVTDTLANDSSSATAMGMMGDGYSFNELIGQMSDRDYFSFVAEQTGTISLSASATHDLTAQWELIGGGGSVNGDTLSFDVVAGQTYTVGLMTSNGIGHYSVDVQLESSIVDWGTVIRAQHDDLTASDTQWYEIAAHYSGLFTAEARFDDAQGSATIEIYDTTNTLVGTTASSNGYFRSDVQVSAGETLRIKFVGSNTDIDVSLSNFVRVDNARVHVYGSGQDDVFAYQLNSTHHVLTANGLEYQFAIVSTNDIRIHAGRGTDQIVLQGGAGAETTSVYSDKIKFNAVGRQRVTVYDIENAVVHQNAEDRAFFYDTAGNETIDAHHDYVQLSGAGFSHIVHDAGVTVAYSTAGGHDVAHLYDSPASDTFVGKSTFQRFSGEGFNNRVIGFEQSFAHSVFGGQDLASFYDSSGNDTLIADPNSTRFHGDGFDTTASGFDRVTTYSRRGGVDVALLQGSLGDDVFVFRQAHAYLKGDGFRNDLHGFDQVNVLDAGGGYDVARFKDVAATEVLSGVGPSVSLAGSSDASVNGFDYVAATALAGESPTAQMQAVDYLYNLWGDWL